ncbi:putative leader peptide [Streptomyces flavofungini]
MNATTARRRVAPVAVLAPRRRVHLYTRAHIDLRRVAGALCRS